MLIAPAKKMELLAKITSTGKFTNCYQWKVIKNGWAWINIDEQGTKFSWYKYMPIYHTYIIRLITENPAI